jgi:hypothetical protein
VNLKNIKEGLEMSAKVKKIVFFGAVIVICALLSSTLVNKQAPSSPVQEDRHETQARTTEVLQPKTNKEVTTEYDRLLEEVSTDIIERIQPITWYRQRFDGKAEGFSDEDLVKAKKIVSTYYNNFSKIKSIRFHELKATKALKDNRFTRFYINKRKSGDNYSRDIAITRDPLYFKITGIDGTGSEIEEIITPLGKVTSGHMGRGESWIPFYLEGERAFMEAGILKYSTSVKENMTMDYKPSGLEEFIAAKNIEQAKYDVIEHLKSEKGFRRTYWFNKETGMLDFAIAIKLDPKEKENPFYDATVIEYYVHDGIYYPKHVVHFGKNYQIRREEQITDLTINGTEIE